MNMIRVSVVLVCLSRLYMVEWVKVIIRMRIMYLCSSRCFVDLCFGVVGGVDIGCFVYWVIVFRLLCCVWSVLD